MRELRTARRVRLLGTVAVLVIALSACGWPALRCWPGHGVSHPFPDSAPGPHSVGHTTVTVPATSDRPPLTVDVWYPSRDAAGSKATYSIVPGVDIPARLAVDGAPPAVGRFPLVLYSHGGGGFSVVATFFTEVLASHGYVVAAPDHPGDTIIDSALGLNNTDYPSNVANRVSGLQRVITALTEPEQSTPTTVSGMVDPRRIVSTGHSLGGTAAVGLAAADPRVDAVIAMDPTANILTGTQLAAVRVPSLMLWSANGIDASEPPTFDPIRSPRFQVEIPTARHLGFTDFCSYQPLLPTWIDAIKKLDPSLDIGALANFDFPGNCSPPTMSPQHLHDLADGYSLAFLDYTLLHDRTWKHVLETAQPGAQVTSSGTWGR